MGFGRDDRQAISRLADVEGEAFEFLNGIESEILVSIPELCANLTKPKIQMIGISCATGSEREEDLNVASSVGFFSRVIRQKTAALVQGLERLGKEVQVTLFIQDLEFTRAWGWLSRSHEELKLEAWLQVEMAKEENRAPPGEIVFWSDVESGAVERGCIGYEEALRWATEPGQAKDLDADIRYRLSIPKLHGARRCELESSSIKRLADYAMIGEAFEILYPDAIFVQAADARTDHMLGLRRKKPLPIIHPWR